VYPWGHVEAGLRSRDRSMPEEINRVLTDQLSDWLFTPSADGDENLLREGIDAARIHRVGNVMIDTLARMLPCAEEHFPAGLTSPYALVTLHGPRTWMTFPGANCSPRSPILAASSASFSRFIPAAASPLHQLCDRARPAPPSARTAALS
jgi:hypothetical protein